MGESSFWYRPTRVVPDQRPLNGRCVVVVVASLSYELAVYYVCVTNSGDVFLCEM